jgi:hypothetical protein
MGKRRPLFSALSISCAVLVASPSWAAIVEPGYGDLTINQGQGFKPVASRSNANIGDSVMVGPSGSATLTYEDGCKVNVQPGTVITVAPLSPCASGSNAQTGPNYYPDRDNDPLWGWVVGGLAGVGLGIAIWQASKDHGNTQPASP